MGAKHGTGYPPAYLPDATVAGGEALHSEIGVTLAGSSRHLWEYVVGSVVDGSQPCALIPPHSPGTPGHDHSGGVMGRPIRRPYWSAMFGWDDAQSGANVENGRGPQAWVTATAVGIPKIYLFDERLRTVWIPGCPPDGAHHKGDMYISVYASNTMTLTWAWETQYGTQENTASISSGTNTVVASDVKLIPGRFQDARLQIYFTNQGPYSPARTCTLLGLSLNQAATSAP